MHEYGFLLILDITGWGNGLVISGNPLFQAVFEVFDCLVSLVLEEKSHDFISPP